MASQGKAQAVRLAKSADRESTLLAYAVSHSPAIFYVADASGDRPVTYISPNVEALTGHAPEAFLGEPNFGRGQIHPDDRDDYNGAVAGLWQHGETSREYRFRTVDGAYLWFRDNLRLTSDPDNGQGHIVGCMIDITPRKQAQKEGSRVTRLLEDALRSVPNGFVIYDTEDRLALCNGPFAKIYGEEPEALIGRPCLDLLAQGLPLVRGIDGQKAEDFGLTAERLLSRIRNEPAEPLEIELTDGTWLLLTGYRTGEGGTVMVHRDITKAKAAEAAQREREQLFRRIVEAQPVPVWMAEIDSGVVLYESPAVAKLFGRGPTTDGTRNVISVYGDPAERPKLIAALRKTGAIDDYRVELRRPDGVCFSVSATARLLWIDEREVILSSMIDLTEQLRREAELRQARDILEDAIESLSEGFALFDSEDRLVMCNQRYRDFNKESADQLVSGVRWQDFIRVGATRGQYVEAVGRVEEWVKERAIRRGQVISDLEVQQTDGRWFAVSNQRTREGGIVATRRDVTERREMEQAQRDNEARLRRVLEASPVPIVMSHLRDGLVIYGNPTAKELFGDSDVEGKKTSHGFYVRQADRDSLLALLRRDERVDNFEVELRKADGSTFWSMISSRLIRFQGEDVIVSTTIDLTERREFEAEMARQSEILHQSEKLGALGSLLAGVAHELNNPLSIVVGQAQLLREAAEDEKIAKRAKKIGDAADRCARIVRSFLAMARQRPPQRAQVDLNRVIASVLEMLGYALRADGITVTTKLSPNLPSIWGDSDLLNQVFANLVVNAQQVLRDHAGERQLRIKTTYNSSRGYIKAKVIDSGPGVAREIRSRIFEPFFTTKAVGEGTGIGLSVSYGIVESHDGTLEVQSLPDRGATFNVTLPISQARKPAGRAAKSAEQACQACRVLVIDDEPEIAQTLNEILTADGHTVVLAVSGRSALSCLEMQSVDLILCDLRMPDMDGRGFFEILRQRHPDLVSRLIFVTGDTFGPRTEQFLSQSGRPVLEKPFTPRDLRRVLRAVTGGAKTAGRKSSRGTRRAKQPTR